NRGQGMNPRGGNAAGYGGAPNRVGNVGSSKNGSSKTCEVLQLQWCRAYRTELYSTKATTEL
nr:hypothetical protein [Tanacetum cinerariifolium]